MQAGASCVALPARGGEPPAQLAHKSQPASDTERTEAIDFPAQFQLHRQNCVEAQVAKLVDKQSSLVTHLRTIFPPDCDQHASLSPDALRRAQRNQVLERKHNEQAQAVRDREVKRKRELGITEAAEGFMRSKGHNPTDLARRGDLLRLQAGGRDTNGNWVNTSKDGSPSILQHRRLWQETDKRSVGAEVLKAATAQVEQVMRVQSRKDVQHPEVQASNRAHLGPLPPSLPASPPNMEADTPRDILEPSGPMSMEVDTSDSAPLTAETPATLSATAGAPWPTLRVSYSG